MTVNDLFKLLPCTQEVHLIYEDLEIRGTADSIETLCNSEVGEMDVINLETEKDTLKVWTKKVLSAEEFIDKFLEDY